MERADNTSAGLFEIIVQLFGTRNCSLEIYVRQTIYLARSVRQ